eukprot:CAMPEP_0198608736 /NCGR_PEP_ID=MMETSP1462-20131121/156044_1 /TAXON_ID=1333877 /ORGANISM="Brandtodinium nutriculum, Strain RCC3387" /LENGTH=494 /DNA_ID=CAMNT_0044340541 /DNA_START=23 /DNA_END=1505 /DNA_ORIENTATION=-
MIEYKGISWQIGLIFKAKGSVFPKALMWALPCTAVSLSVSYTHRHLYGESPTGRENHSTLVSLFAALTSVLGFLICFRTNSAYGRYWEGITLLRIARGEWFNAYSSILSFCSGDADKLELVEAFQHQLARFMSILNCVALQTVTEEFVERFPTLDTCGLDDAGLTFLASKRDPNQRMEILLANWLYIQGERLGFPKGLDVGFAGTAVSLAVSYSHKHFYGESMTSSENHSTLVSLFAALTSVLGFLICFRTNIAYGRYWEGITLLRTGRGEWFNAYSSILSFCSGDESKLELVEAFQHQLARFMSILSCVALQTITEEFVERFPTLGTCGLEDNGLTFLASKRDPNQRMEILTQWIQRIVVEADQSGLIIVSPPILSRSFQEISRGAVNLTRARNMTEVPFPFPYVQLVTTILVVHSCLMPVLLNVVLESSLLSAAVTFIGTFTFWGMNYISAEIESPFGKDPNALPLHRLQEDFNASLWGLLERRSQTPAKFS